MKILGWFILVVIFSLSIHITYAQVNINGSSTHPLPEFVRRNEEARQRQAEQIQRNSPNQGEFGRNSENIKRPIFIEEPRLSAEDFAKIQPDREDFSKYSQILALKNTGLVKILLDPKCSNLIIDLKDEKCSQAFPLKGSGSFYSFRTNSHADSPSADIHYIDGKFEVGFKDELLGILVELGDVPIESLDLINNDVWVLNDFKISNKLSAVEKQKAEIKQGISKFNRTFTSKISVKPDTTYLVRTIAYRYSEQAINDKRIDALLAFRVVKKEANAVTILWRGLNWKDSPKLKMDK